MSQGLSRPLPAPAGVVERPARNLPDELSARTLLSRGQVVVGAAVLTAIAGVLGIGLVTGGPALRDVAVAAIAVATFAYVVVIGFRLALVTMAQGAPVIRFTAGELGAAGDETQLILVQHMEHMFAQAGPAPIDPSLPQIGADVVNWFERFGTGS